MPACSFTDSWSSGMQKEDYKLLRSYFENPTRWDPAVAWTPAQLALVYAHPNVTNPITFTTAIPNNNDPSRACPGLDSTLVYDAKTNPKGVRCTLADYMKNVFDLRPDGKAGKPFDNTGIQYGLAGLKAGVLTPTQFVDVNVKVGSRDIDDEPQAQRFSADRFALQRALRSGAVNTADHLDDVAIIDLRGPDPGAFQDVYRTYAMRERLVREHGTAANQVLWRGQVPLFGDPAYENEAVLAMDRWLEAVEQDRRAVPLSRKVLDARVKAGVADRCTNGARQDVPASVCDATVESYGTPRFEAGMPLADDTVKCQLVPMKRSDYPSVADRCAVRRAAAGLPDRCLRLPPAERGQAGDGDLAELCHDARPAARLEGLPPLARGAVQGESEVGLPRRGVLSTPCRPWAAPAA
jgi:hypothetical protein